MNLGPPVPLAETHDLATFDSGNPTLDDWLRRRARPNQVSGATRTFIVREGPMVAAYYALASGSIAAADATGRFRRNMPDPIPVVILARLAVGRAWQGRGLGRALIRDTGLRAIAASDAVGIRGLLTHAVDESARAFYLAVGFGPSPTNPLTLMITMADLRASL